VRSAPPADHPPGHLSLQWIILQPLSMKLYSSSCIYAKYSLKFGWRSDDVFRRPSDAIRFLASDYCMMICQCRRMGRYSVVFKNNVWFRKSSYVVSKVFLQINLFWKFLQLANYRNYFLHGILYKVFYMQYFTQSILRNVF